MDDITMMKFPTREEMSAENRACIERLKQDPEEEMYIGWHMKHMNSSRFFSLWNKLQEYPDEIITECINDDNKFKPVVDSQNWMLMSRQCNFNDEKFMKHFSNRIVDSFAKQYNPSYNFWKYNK